MTSRYIIGIDLGTTNSCVAFVDTDCDKNPRLQIRSFPIPQLVSQGVQQPKQLLPSFYYLPAVNEFPEGALKLSWEKKNAAYVIGYFAKELGAKVPTALVQSAKSWLCNPAADRKEKILPIEAASPSDRISPVQATAAYLRHILNAWNDQVAKQGASSDFEQQEIILTVPASFDEVARMLTVEAAKLAGYKNLTLLEEPQAAFYAWLQDHEEKWKQQFKGGETILVCDVGGGTTDFSLIEVTPELTFQRMAVGDHLLLGGDNMDHAISHLVEEKLHAQGVINLTSSQWLQLIAASREAKEKLLGDSSSKSFSICLQGSGSQVVGGSLNVEVQRQEIEALLLDGFFGLYPLSEALHLNQSAGIRTMGLPYESDPSITKHLAVFLQQASDREKIKKPDFVLFNGGSMKPTSFQRRVLESLSNWFGGVGSSVLPTSSLDLAVSRGAAYFGKARRGLGVRIGGGTPRSYYLVIDVKAENGSQIKKALTLLPRGSHEGIKTYSDRDFLLLPNAPVSFHLLTSHTRLHDQAGNLVDINEEEMFSLPPIHTLLRFGKKQQEDNSPAKVPVKLFIQLTEIGTIELGLESQKTDHKWILEFQVRSQGGEDNSLISTEKARVGVHYGEEELKAPRQKLRDVFSDAPRLEPNQLMAELQKMFDEPRDQWSLSLLRGLWDTTFKLAAYRFKSLQHQQRWWNLIGFLLRPGYGYPLDDFRIKELWKLVLNENREVLSSEVYLQQLICYRRIAGGLNRGQQTQLVSSFVANLLSNISSSKLKLEINEYIEQLRTLASMELLDQNLKIKLGEKLVRKITDGKALPCDVWALGRIASRQLIRGGISNVISKDVCAQWIEKLVKWNGIQSEEGLFLLEQMARKTAHREVNISPATIQMILELFESSRLSKVLTLETELTEKEQDKIFGEHLPAGLLLN